MKKLLKSLLPLLAVLAAACGSQTPDLKNYTLTVYAPSHASGFEIVGAEGRQSTLLKVFNPWRRREHRNDALHRPQRRKGPGRIHGTDRRSRSETHCLHVFDLCRDARCPGTGRPRDRGFRPGLHHQHLCHNTPRRGGRRGFRRQCGLRTTACTKARPRAVVRCERRQRHGAETARNGNPVRLHRANTSRSRRSAKPNGWSPSRKSPTAGQKAKPFSPRFPNATMRSKNGRRSLGPRSEGDGSTRPMPDRGSWPRQKVTSHG